MRFLPSLYSAVIIFSWVVVGARSILSSFRCALISIPMINTIKTLIATVPDDDDEIPLDFDEDDENEDESYRDLVADVISEEDKIVSTQAVEQEIDGTSEEMEATEKIIELMNEYLDTEVAKPKYNSVRFLCINKESLCAFWASVDECTKNEDFMSQNCALACRSCHILLNDGKHDEL